MLKTLLPALAALPLFAQFDRIELRFEGMGCASCIESMPARIKRMRGVEEVSVDAAASILKIRLAESNRVRLEQVRDAIQQDGTKVKSAGVVLRGAVTRQDGKWTVQPLEGGASYVLEGGGPWSEGKRYRIEGNIADPAPGALLRVTSMAARAQTEPRPREAFGSGDEPERTETEARLSGSAPRTPLEALNSQTGFRGAVFRHHGASA